MATKQIQEREIVLSILMAVTEEGEFFHLVIRDVLEKYAWLSKQERSFIRRLSEGTIERMIELDAILSQFSKTPLKKMKPLIRNILRMGVYQLKYMDSVPDRAAVNEAVKLANKHGLKGLSGFVNGVLRNISRNLDGVALPDEKKDEVRHLSVKYSMPEWIVKRFLADHGREQTENILSAYLSERPLTVRVNTRKIEPDVLKKRFLEAGITVEIPGKELFPEDYVFFLKGYDSIASIPGFGEGLFYIQDLSSMMVAEIADPKPGSTIIDVCSAPGGKSLHLFDRLGGDCTISMRDLTEEKTMLMEENVLRNAPESLGKQIQIRQWDATIPDEEAVSSADLVIADLPCSGLGVIGRKADIKYRLDESQIKSLAKLQKQILSVVSNYVKPSGNLVYSTCTLTQEENQNQLRDFLKEHTEYTLISERTILPNGIQDGFYIAKLIRE